MNQTYWAKANYLKLRGTFKKIMDEGPEDPILPMRLALKIAEDRGFLQDMKERGTGVWADDYYEY